MLSEGFFHAFMMKGSRKVKNMREKREVVCSRVGSLGEAEFMGS
jgi:hypothetical protein